MAMSCVATPLLSEMRRNIAYMRSTTLSVSAEGRSLRLTVGYSSGGHASPLATARTVDTTLGAIYRNFLRGVAVKEQNEEDDRLAERYLWFIVTALVLLIAGASLSRGRPRSRRLAARRGAAA